VLASAGESILSTELLRILLAAFTAFETADMSVHAFRFNVFYLSSVGSAHLISLELMDRFICSTLFLLKIF